MYVWGLRGSRLSPTTTACPWAAAHHVNSGPNAAKLGLLAAVVLPELPKAPN